MKTKFAPLLLLVADKLGLVGNHEERVPMSAHSISISRRITATLAGASRRFGSLVFVVAVVTSRLSAQDITTGLVTNLTFDGTTADSSPNRYTFTEAGVMRYSTDRFGAAGKAIDFVTATADSIFLRGTGPVLANQSSSISFWIKKNGPSPGWLLALSADNASGAIGNAMHIAISENAFVRYSFFYDDFDSSFVPSQGVWYHWAFTFDAATRTRRFYVNGSLVTMNQAAVGFNGGNSLRISSTNMTLDDFRLYNRALTAADVAALSNSPGAPSPVILAQPSASVAVPPGQTLSLSVQATGAGVLSYQWSKNGAAISGATGVSYSLPNFQSGNVGNYAVTVSNYVGSVQSTAAVVSVGTPPVFSVQPASKVVALGETVTLAAQASGSLPVSYQWVKDGVAIAGASSATLTISNIQPTRIGDYSAVATAGTATATSNAASITIAGVPSEIWRSLVAYYLFDGTASDQSSYGNNATPAGNSQYLTNGLSGGALRITGDNSLFYSGGGHVLLPQFGTYMNSGFTCSLWVKDESIGSDPVGQEDYLSYGILDQARFGISLNNNGGRLAVEYYMDTGLGGAAHLDAVSILRDLGDRNTVANTWKNLVIVYSPGRFTAFLSGVKVGEKTITFTGHPLSRAALGRHWWSGGGASSARMTATYDNVRFYNRALSDSEVQLLYASEAPAVAPVISAFQAAQSVVAGQSIIFSAVATGTSPLTYQWRKDGVIIAGATGTTFTIDVATSADAGAYTVVVSNAAGATTSTSAALTVKPANPGRLGNLSIRTSTGAGNGTLIVGFVLGGSGTSGLNPLLARAAGPALTQFGVTGTLPDPVLSLYDGGRLIDSNDNWGGGASLAAIASSVAAFSFPSSSKDAALAVSLNPGSYTAQVFDATGGAGVTLAELYDTSASFSYTKPRLINVSARANVGVAGDIMIAGFVVKGDTAITVLVRAVGPTLSQFSVTGTLANPRLTLFRDSTILANNDDWGDVGASTVASTAASVGAFALPVGSKDAAIVATLQPGSYSAQVSGVSNTTGIALVEVYEVP